MSVQYLVDFENVHECGLAGMRSLSAEDSVYIFHTSNSDRVFLSCLDNVQAWVKVIRVPPGYQSLDMHLASFLGYLIGKEEDPESRYAIVSKDTDYDGVADFWNGSCQMGDKVLRMQEIHWLQRNDYCRAGGPPVYQDPEEEKNAIRDFTIRVFEKNAVFNRYGEPRMLLSDLCSWLNNLPQYVHARRRLDMRPKEFLCEECRDFLWVCTQQNQDWAYLQVKKEEPAPAIASPAVRKPEFAEAAEPEEELPDIMEIGDLSIPDQDIETDMEDSDYGLQQEFLQGMSDEGYLHAETDRLSEADREQAGGGETAAYGDLCEGNNGDLSGNRASGASGLNEERPNAESVADKPEYPPFMTFAMNFIREMAESEKNAHGSVRASVLRDRLLPLPEFRTALKQSGMKPIPFMQQFFTGYIRVYREKNTYWASLDDADKENTAVTDSAAQESRNTVLDKCKMSFYEKAFSNIRAQLSGSGLENDLADEIADVCIRANAADEPRKVIHNLLCQHFGQKAGAQYYRKAVKYLQYVS